MEPLEISFMANQTCKVMNETMTDSDLPKCEKLKKKYLALKNEKICKTNFFNWLFNRIYKYCLE